LPKLLLKLGPSVTVVSDQLGYQPLDLGGFAGIAAVVQQADRVGSGAQAALAVAVTAFLVDTSLDGHPSRKIRIDEMVVCTPAPAAAMEMTSVPLAECAVLAGSPSFRRRPGVVAGDGQKHAS
jgi:hypothetical protein